MSSLNLATELQRLLSTLHNSIHIPATSYSKVPWGLCVPLEESGVCTGKVCSEASNWGQWRSRYAVHAGRHSNDKAFRYLKRIIVIPAVYLLLAPLNWNLKYKHWADVTNYTHLYRLAVS